MDDRNKENRSATMRAVKSQNTQFEKNFVKSLRKSGIRGLRSHPKNLYGNPDLIHPEVKLAIFLDSCFWHGCVYHCRMPSTNKNYWQKKIRRNRRRDKKVAAELTKRGWVVKRIWEHSLAQPSKQKWWVTRLKNLTNGLDHL